MIRFRDFSFGYKEPLFINLNLSIETNKITILTGENGSGKTTLCRILSGLEKNYQGSLQITDKEIKTLSVQQLAAKFLYLKQEPLSNVVAATPDEDLAIWQSRFADKLTEEHQKKREEVLAELEISELLETPFWEMSSGQVKRSGMAALLLNPQKYWILDEPFTGLHREIVQKLIEILQTRKESGLGALIISHKTDEFSSLADRILKIEDRRIKEI